MKKFQKICAVLTALVLGLICFAGCSNDAGGSSDNGGNVSNNGGGNNGGGNSNNEEETPKVTVVAEYQYSGLSPYIYIFYSDETYEYKEFQRTVEKGKYKGNPTKRGTMTMQRQYSIDGVSGDLISDSENYQIVIYKDEKDDLVFEDEWGYTFFLN